MMTAISMFSSNENILSLCNINNVNISNGLSHNGVTATMRDSRGYLWICTYDGLNQYNGFTVKIYKNTLSENLFNSNRIRCIAEDEYGRLWLGTDEGITVFDYDKYKFYRLSVDNKNEFKSNFNFIIRRIMFDKHRKIMICLSESNGILEYDMNLSLVTNISYPKRLEANDLCAIDANNYLLSSNIGIFCYNTTNKELYKINNDKIKDSSCLRVSRNNNIYISSGSILYDCSHVVDNGILSEIKIHNTFNIVSAIKTFELEDNERIWIGTVNDGVMVYPSDGNSEYQMKLLDYKRISEISFLDNSYCISTFDGGIHFYSFKNEIFKKVDFKGFKFYQVAAYGDGLLAKNNKSLYLYDFRQNKISEFASVISKELQNNVKSFYVDSLDRLWILTKENRLFSYDKNTKLKEYKDVKLLLLKDDSPQIFYSDPMGNIWLGYIDNLYRISFTSDHEIDEVESIHQNVMFDSCGISKIRAMYWDSRTSSMFVGTDVQGMYQLYIDRQKPIKDIKIEHYMFDKGDKHSLSSNFVSSIIRDKSGILWFGTEQGGLCRAIEEDGQRMKFISYSEEDGLSNNVVKSLLGDKSGNLWIATNIGLNIYRNDSGSFHVYRTSDGLPFDDFWYASFMMNDGTLVFSKFEGFCYFNPDLLPNKEELPQLHIRSFNVLSDKILPNEIYNDRIIIDSRLSDNDVLNLKYNENSISFDIDALYSKVATDHFIRYKLEPLNDEWIQIPAKDQKLSFNGLKPDNYRLSLSASNSFDEWTKPISIGINIAPPFSRSAIAYVIYVLLALLFISIIVYNLMRVQRLKYELREEAIQKRSLELLNIEKQRFFSNISHELKTPLTLILAPITVLSERFLLDIDVKEKLAIIKRQAKKMLNLIELSHELQLNERNMLKVKPCMFSFNKFLKDITEDFMFMAKYDNKDFVVNYPNKNVNVYADYSMIEQMLNNLLTNSFKHTVQRDKVGIDISYHDQLLTIKVYDTGDGISEKDLPYIFDRFYQASNQGLKNIGGTGIGLAFTKRLIELHSGNIGVESKLGEGSTFTVNLPIIQNVTEADVIDETNEQEGETDLYVGDWDIKSIEIDSKYLRFLVYLVEDNTEMRSFLTEIIGQFFTVKSFANGKECLDGMNKEWPDIIVSDVMMPEMDGNELCNVIKSDLKTSHIPVILLTACNTVDDKIKGLQSGADAYIPKPFYPKHVLTRICTLLDNRAKLWERFQSGVPLNIAANENEVSAKDNEFICALYAKFNEYVDDECVDMELLAKEIGVNRSLFFQKVKALTNDSPFELLKNYRLQRAAELLVKEEYNVNEVCMMTGFKSRTHFSRLFKEKYGVAPSKYKESVVNRI